MRAGRPYLVHPDESTKQGASALVGFAVHDVYIATVIKAQAGTADSTAWRRRFAHPESINNKNLFHTRRIGVIAMMLGTRCQRD